MTGAAGSLVIAAPVAIAAGALSFASPCVLPLVPGYLSYVTGMSGAGSTPAAASTRPVWQSRTVLGAVLFIAGFTVVFVGYGAVFGGLGEALARRQRPLQVVLGSLTVLLGLLFAGALSRFRWSAREFRVHRLPSAGLSGAPLLGALFGLGWTPCIGPTLATVLTLAASDSAATAARGATLTAFYCVGLGIPFLLVAAGVQRGVTMTRWLRDRMRFITFVGGCALVAVGLLEVTGVWTQLVAQLQGITVGFTPLL